MNTTSFDFHMPQENVVAPLNPLQVLLEQLHGSELLSSRAFFNPNMLGQLYFPDEHKFAVYTPLFGPLAVPLLVAAIRLIKERRRRLPVQTKIKASWLSIR
jgi:phosphatidylinositol glycan class S